MPAVVLPLIAFAIGASLSWAAAAEIARRGGSALATRSLVLAALLGVLVIAPIAAYLFAFHPDWAYAYVIDSTRVPGVVHSAVVLACATAPALGFTVTAPFAGERRLGRVVEIAGAATGVALLALLPGVQRLGVQATYQQFHGDFGVAPLAGSRLGLGLAWMMAVIVGAVLWTATSMRQFSRSPSQP